MKWTFDILLILFFIFAAGAYAGAETGGYLLNRIRLSFRARQRGRAARRLKQVLADAYLFIFTVLIGHNLAVYLVSRSVTRIYLQTGLPQHSRLLFGFLPWTAETAATLTLMLPLFLFAEIIPKNIFRRHADTLMYRSASWLNLSRWLFLPVTALLKMLFTLLTGGQGRSEALSGFSLSLQGLREYFFEDTQRTALSDYQHGMIDNLVSMHRVPVREIMQPASAMALMSERETVQKAIDLMRERQVDEVAVYRGSIRKITGFVTLFDLMNPELKPSGSIKPHLRKMTRIAEDLPLTRAFRHLRQKTEPVALVTDRASRTVGVLHLRDLAGYIVRSV
jgi:CBS domain containing-hemolysin-like protein